MKYIWCILLVLAVTATSCRRYDNYVCQCNNAKHADSSQSFRLGEVSSITRGYADTVCNVYQGNHPTDSCYVTTKKLGVPM